MSYKHRYKTGIPYLGIVVFFFVSSCSAPKLPVYPVRQVDYYQHVLTRDGLQMIVDPMFDSQENKIYFGRDLFQKNILPVFIMVKNLNAKGSYVVSNDKISLNILSIDRMDVNDNFNGADVTDALTSNEGAALLGIVSVPFMTVALLANASQSSNIAEVKRNFKSKKFQTKILSVGGQCSGFVYFRLPEKIVNTEHPSIGIEMMNLQDKRNQTYQIPITWKGEK